MFKDTEKVSREEIAEHLANGTTLITANKRLAREFTRIYNLHQRKNNILAWETPDILPFEAWLQRFWKEIRTDTENKLKPQIIINPLQSKQLWGQIIERDILSHEKDTYPLWNINATVKLASDAWKICQDWEISFNDFNNTYLKDHRNFARWAIQYQENALNNNWIDKYQIPSAITQHLAHSKPADLPQLIWLGFDGITPAQKTLVSAFEKLNANVVIAQLSDTHKPEKHYHEFSSIEEQWLASAQWAKQKLQNNPDCRIAIIAPDLDQSRATLEHTLTQVVSPTNIIDPQYQENLPFHISLGKKLGDIPIIRSAMNLLDLFSGRPIKYEMFAACLLDPFISAANVEQSARHKLEYKCREFLPYQIHLTNGWESILKRNLVSDTPELGKIFDRLRPLLEPISEQAEARNSFSDWAKLFLEWLGAFGWPGDTTLNSADYQTVEAFKRELSNLTSLDLIYSQSKPQVTTANAISLLNGRLRDQPFEPEATSASIEVLGILECSEIEFDYIWFGNLNDKNWPPPIQRNPFIPTALQLKVGYYKSDLSLNSRHAHYRQNQLINHCGEIVFSRAQIEDDVEQQASPLINFLIDPSTRLQPTTYQLTPGLSEYFLAQKPDIEHFDDYMGLPLANSSVRGGTFVIEDQSACPFRSYAIHRLNAREIEFRQPGLNPMDRGSLIHRILEQIWAQLRTSSELLSTDHQSQQSIDKLISQSIHNSSKKFYHQSGCESGFFQAQSQWLKNLIKEWLEVERGRKQPFSIKSLEQPYTLKLGNLTLTFQIDRLDKLEDGSVVLIDYKTGKAPSISSWTGERPQQPQLPLYALAEMQSDNTTNISAMGYAQIRFGESGLFGMTVDQVFHKEDYSGHKLSYLDKSRIDDELKSWPALLSYWSSTFEQLANEFSEGVATVNPRDNQVCSNCNLFGLCRLSEIEQQQESKHGSEPNQSHRSNEKPNK